jgi:hypothetical protein
MTKDIIQNWLNETQTLMVDKYDQLGFRASGEWEQSLSNSIEEKEGSFVAKIEGANYTYWMEHGRKPGKFPPMAAIRKWIDDKGIIAENITRNSLAFLIARKIAREGTQIRPGIVSDVITQERIDSLIKDIGALFVTQVKSDVIKAFK